MSVIEMPTTEERLAMAASMRALTAELGGPEQARVIPIGRWADVAATPEQVDAIMERAASAIAELDQLDPDAMNPDTMRTWAADAERLRRQADALCTRVAEHVDAAEPFRDDGWFTAKRWLKHSQRLSGPEAHARVQSARFSRRVPAWIQAEREGRVGVAQVKVMASIAANPRLDDDALTSGARSLLDDAINRPFDEFERLARTWELLADPRGALDAAERNRDQRDASIAQRPDDGWTFRATLDDVAGAELAEILCWFTDAEFRTDWADAVERLGEGTVSMTDLRRTEPQRRADALVAMARAAASAPADAKRPAPTVNIVTDASTVEAWAGVRDGIDPLDPPSPSARRTPAIDPAGYHDVICRTERGHRVHPAHAVDATLWGHIRRVVVDSKGVVTDLGRRSRLFTGGARESVMLLETSCVWTGCDQPSAWCHADHIEGWSRARGPTRPDNGAPLCPRHNYLKEQGFSVTRDAEGDWHVYAPDGHEVA